ncbi:MAG: tetratricopeptide repeat protein [Planctomycetes bacterium]|nr:tetratricopeptide repeat protein [Planctomycetota bacterium]
MKLSPTFLVPALLLSCATDAVATPRASTNAPSAERAPSAMVAAAATAAQDTVDALLLKGREKLAAGDAAGAQVLFDQAAAQEKDSLRTRMWVLRAWMDQGRVNDAYNAIDALAKTNQGVEIDYLYGMAFATDAKRGIESGQAGPMTGTKIEDAFQFLAGVAKKDAARFPDALAMLCWAAWESQKLDDGRAAAETFSRVAPPALKSAAAYQLGRFALAQFQRDQADEAKKDVAEQHWNAAKAAFGLATTELEGKSDPASRALLARVSIDLGHVHVWKKDVDAAVAAYGKGVGLDPTLANYPQLLSSLGAEKLLAALDVAEADLVKLWGAENQADATLLWWLGWSRLQQKQYEPAEQAFTRAVAKFEGYVNSWFYVAVCRFSRQDLGGAVEAIQKHQKLNAADLTATIQQNLAFNLPMLDALVGFCAEKNPPRNLDAGLLSEAQAAAKPDDVRYWNNAGLFYRDAGEPLGRSKDEEKKKQAMALWEKAYSCYSQALDLAKDDPAILNDTAVMLHYYLDRDLDKAKVMYQRSNQRAKELLEKGGLKPEQKDLYEVALRDSGNNLKKLEAGIKTNG